MYYKNLTVFLAILLAACGNSFEFPRQNGDATTLPHASRVRVQCTAILGSADSEDRSIFAMETHNRVRWWSVTLSGTAGTLSAFRGRRGGVGDEGPCLRASPRACCMPLHI